MERGTSTSPIRETVKSCGRTPTVFAAWYHSKAESEPVTARFGQGRGQRATPADGQGARALSKTSDARMAAGGGVAVATFDRMKRKVTRAEAVSQAKAELAGDDFEDRLAALGREDEIDKMLNDLKARRSQS